MKCLVSLDGLSSEELVHLCQLLPLTKPFIESADLRALDNCVLTQPQPIWAEILTGTAWHENGCSAFSSPRGTLNKLAVVSEKELLTRAKLLDEGSGRSVVSINLPLARPKPPHRFWLSDGSLPMNKQVSPPSLITEEPFKSYQARPFMDVAAASSAPRNWAQSSMSVEKKRIACALDLLKRFPYHRFIFRLTIFDHLSHLLGLNYLQSENLVIYEELVKFCAVLDAALSEIISACSGELLILSGYSHQPCKRTLSLNSILEQGGMLQVSSQVDDLYKRRISANAAVLGHEPASLAISSYEGQIDLQATIAASCSYGCVYLNRSDVFENGSVTPASYEGKRAAVLHILQTELTSRFGNSLHIAEAPEEAMKIAAPIPEFIVSIDGVEFHNIRHANMRDYDVPRTTHSSSGFLLAPKSRLRQSGSIKLTEITELFS